MAEYIERESLLKQMQANFQQGSWYGCDEPMYPIVEETILEVPAADVAPVVHGHPVTKNRTMAYETIHFAGTREDGESIFTIKTKVPENSPVDYCSICGKRLCSRFTNYCPNCGAKMDKEANDAQ